MPNYRNKNKNRRNKNRNKNNNQNKNNQETQQREQQQDNLPKSTKTAITEHDNEELQQHLGCIPNVSVQTHHSPNDDDIITAHTTPPTATETNIICNAPEHSSTSEVSEVSCTEQVAQESTTTEDAISIGGADTVSRDPPSNIDRLQANSSSTIATTTASLAEDCLKDLLCPTSTMGANNSKQQSSAPSQPSSSATDHRNDGTEMKTISITRQQGKVIVHRIIQEATTSTSEEDVSSVSSHQDDSDPKLIVHHEPCPEMVISEEKDTVQIHQEGSDGMAGKDEATTQQAKIIVHKIVHQEYRVDSPQPITSHKSDAKLPKTLSLDEDEEETQFQIQEISDNSSGGETDTQPLISEAESESEDDRALVQDPNNNGELPKPIASNQDNYKQRRAQKRAAIENHFLPQFLSPRYLDSILEENSDMSDARSEKSNMALSRSTSENFEDEQLDDEHESKAKKANAVFPKSNLDFSKKHKHGTVPKAPTLPAIIREETVPMMVEAKIIEQPIITERCSTWSSAQTPESEAAEVVYINSASSSISDLLELDYDESVDKSKRSAIDLDTDVNEIFAKPSDVHDNLSQSYLDDDQRERTPVNETSSPAAIVVDRTHSTSKSTKTIQAKTNTYTEKITYERMLKQCKTSGQNGNSNEQLLAANKNTSSSTHSTLAFHDCSSENIENSEISENYALAEAANISGRTSPTSSVSIANDNAQYSEILSNFQMNDIREILNDAANKSSVNVSETVERSSAPIVPRRVVLPLPATGSHSLHNDSPPPIPPPPQTYNQSYASLDSQQFGPTSTQINNSNADPTLTLLHPQQQQIPLATTTSSTKSNNSSLLTRQESGESHGSDSTTHSQCTAINLGSLTQFDCADFDTESSVSGGISAPTTDGSVGGDQSVNLDSSEAESNICLEDYKDTGDSSIKKLRLLCTETLASMPYGEDILEELANVAQNIGEIRATKTITKLSEMPYPLPDLPHISDIQVSTSSSNLRKPANVTLTQVPPTMNTKEKLVSPPPPPVPEPPSKYVSWLGVPTESDPKLLVCLSPSQRSFMADDKAAAEQKPDHLLDAHKKFLERRGYHEYTADQVNAINRERVAENQIIQTAAMMKQLRKSLTPPPLPPPPVPPKSSDTKAKALIQKQQQQLQYEKQQNQHEKQATYDNSNSNGIANEQRSLFDNEDENKHRLLAIIHDNTNKAIQNRPLAAAASSSSSSSNENNSRQRNAQAALATKGKEAEAHSSAVPLIPKQEQIYSTFERITDFANSSLSSKKSEHIDTSALQSNSSTYTTTSSSTQQQRNEAENQISDNKMQGIDAEFSKLFPSLGNTDIFDSTSRRFSNIETSNKEPLSTQLSNKQTKRFSNIETSSYESKKRIENGHVVYDVSDSKQESYTDGEKPDLSILHFPVAEKMEPLHAGQQRKTATSTQQTSHVESSTKQFTPTDIGEIMSALNINTSASATGVPPPSQTDTAAYTSSHSTANKETKQFEKTIFRQNSENSTFNKNISGTYEEFRQRAKAAAEAVAKPLTAPLTSNGDHHQPKSTFHFDHEKLFKDFDELSKQLNFELESGKARKEQREKSASLFDLSRIQNESKSRFEEIKRQRHEHMQELEREIERSRRARQIRVPIQLEKDAVQTSNSQNQTEYKSRTTKIPIHIENGNQRLASESNPVVKEPRTYEIPVQVEPGYTITSPTPKTNNQCKDRFRRAESMFDLSESPKQINNVYSHHLDDHNRIGNFQLDDWTRYAKDLGSSENISRPFAREVEICYQRCKPNSIRAPRMTVSTNDLTTTNNSFDNYNAYNVRRTHAPMLDQAPQKTKPQYLSCHSMIERDPNPTYISTTSRRGVSPAPPTIHAPESNATFNTHENEVRQQRRVSLPREIHEQQLKYITSKEQELKTEFERLENERRRLLEEMTRAPIMPIPSPRSCRPTSKLPTLSEDEVFRQQMAEEWLSKVAEREERRLQKIIKISKINEESNHSMSTQPACPKTDIGNEFLKRVKERRSKLAMPSDSDWESGAESHPISHGNVSETEEVPPVKIIEGRSETDLRQLPKHMREFAKFSNHEREELDGGHREVHQEEERRQESKDNSMSSAVKKSSIIKTYKVSRVPPGIQTFATPTADSVKKSSRTEDASTEEELRHQRIQVKTAIRLQQKQLQQQQLQHHHHHRDKNQFPSKFVAVPSTSSTKIINNNNTKLQQDQANGTAKRRKQTRFLLTPNRRSWSESDLLREIDRELQLAKGFLFADGIWTPKNQTPTTSSTNLNDISPTIPTTSAPTPPPPPSKPVWTPQPSPTGERKEFRPIRFESPTLPRRYTAQSQSTSSPADVQPPWTYNSKIQQSFSNYESCPLPTPPRSANSCTNLSTPNTTVSSSTIYCDSHYDEPLSVSSIDFTVPTTSVSEKIKNFERSASASELQHSIAKTRHKLNSGSAIYKPNEVIYNVKHEYMSEPETENDRPRKMAQLVRRQYDGIGPVTNDGMPIILRSEVKEPHQHEWYKRLYQTIHKQKNGDDYVIRYKSPRGRYQHKTNGYVSEPEPNNESDYSTIKYRTLDRRRLQSTSSSTTNVRNASSTCQDDTIYGTMPNPIKSGQNSYKNQPGRIEDYVTGHSSVSEKEKKEWWDEVMDIFNGWLKDHASTPRIFIEFANQVEDFLQLEQTKLSPHYTEGNLSRALAKESGYASDSNLVFRKKEVPLRNPLSPVEQKQAYKSVQSGGEPPLFGFRKPAPEKPKDIVEEFEYFQITPTLTKIRVHSREIIDNQHDTETSKRAETQYSDEQIISVHPTEDSPKGNMFTPFAKQMPSFLAVGKQQLTNSPPPPPPNRKSSHSRSALKSTSSKTTSVEVPKRPTSSSSSRHEQCFRSPSPKSPKTNKFATFTLRKNCRREPLSRSKSAGAVSSLLATCSKEDSQPNGSQEYRVSRIQNVARLKSVSPTRTTQLRHSTFRPISRSPVAFGRSISKERTFAVEKKRLENSLPAGRANFEASTNILRDPTLKSPDEVKQAMRSYATCPWYARSRSVPRTLSPARYPNFSLSYHKACRHSTCPPQYSEKKITISQKSPSKAGTPNTATIGKFVSYKGPEKSSSTKSMPKASSTTSLARTSSTFSVDSSSNKILGVSNKSKKTVIANKSYKATIKEAASKNLCSTASQLSAGKINKIPNSKSESNILSRVKTKAIPVLRKSTSPLKLRSNSLGKQSYSTHYFHKILPFTEYSYTETSLPSMVHEKTKFWDAYNKSGKNSTFPKEHKTSGVSQSRSLSPSYTRDYLVHSENVFGDECDESKQNKGKCTDDLVWHIEQRSRSQSRSKIPCNVSDIARPDSPAPSRTKREFSPTREIRVPQTPREVRSPSRRRIDSFRPNNKSIVNNVIRASSLSSADDRSKQGLYLCGELAHSATSLDCAEKHSPKCRYRNNSERFNDLNRFYTTLERVGQLERATSAGNLKPIRKEGEPLDFEEWRKIRLHERAEKELNFLVEKLTQDQREKDFVFRPKDIEDVKWSEEKDFGLRSKDKSVEDLREDFEKKIHQNWFDEARKQELDAKKDIYKPYWRSNTVADLASSMEIKYNPEVGSFRVQQKGKTSSEQQKEIRLSKNLMSTLSKDQIMKITHQLNEIYSPESRVAPRVDVSEEYVVTVSHDSKVAPEVKNLKVRCNSTITEADLIGAVAHRKEALSKANTCKQKPEERKHPMNNVEEIAKNTQRTNMEIQGTPTRSSSPIILARETRGAIAAENAKVTFSYPTQAIPPPPPLPYKNWSKQGDVVECKTPIKERPTKDSSTKDTSDNISMKIQFFEERKFDEPPKTIYHAREDSSPDEDEVLRLVEENISKRTNQVGCNHKELSSSLTDLREIFGEKPNSRANFPQRPPLPQPPDEPEEPRSFMSEIEEELYYDREISSCGDGSTENIESYFRSRSASPQSQASSYLYRVHTGEVQKIKDKFESLGRPPKKQHFFGLSPLRKVRSDPELNNFNSESKDAFKTIINIDETGDVSWITHKFEIKNQLLNPKVSRSRSRTRKLISPIPHKDRLMPHIDIISKTAALKQDFDKTLKTQSQNVIRSSGESVEHARCRFEKSADLISAKKSCSSPDVCDSKDISPHLTANWIAHKYPKPVDNILSLGGTKKRNKSMFSPPKRSLNKTEQCRSSSTSPPRPPKLANLHKLKNLDSQHVTQRDIFANQIFDPKKHQPKARYVPDVIETNFWKRSTSHPSCSGTCSSIKKVTGVKFQDYDVVSNVVPPQPPRKGIPLDNNGCRPESPNRYFESDVNIHYKTPIRYEYKDPIPEEELAIRQAEQMQKLYQEERRRKYLQELQDMNSRRHTDNFTPSQKSPIPLNRYDDFQSDLAPKSPKTLFLTKTIARALYNFQGQTARELTFRKGDVIYIRRQIDKNWYEGEHNAMIGLLPANYVEIISRDGVRQPLRKPSEGQARAKFNFQAQSGIELSLNKGELVTLTRRVDKNWFEGKIANRKGIFPVCYVEVLSDIGAEDYSAPRSILTSSTVRPSLDSLRNSINNEFNTITQNGHQPPNGILRETRNMQKTDVLHVDTSSNPIAYRALYKYRPQNSDELELLEGDLVHVLEKCDDGWFVGTSQRTGCFGTFPGNYVERA